MPTMILVRHGRTAANATGILAGRAAGVGLDDVGRKQAHDVAARLSVLSLATVVSSPLQRTVETARAIGAQQAGEVDLVRDKGLIECGYGSWTGRELKTLAKDPLWKTVQQQPSAVVFPEGESMVAMQARAVATVRRLDAAVGAQHGDDAPWVAVSHGDVIKAVVADALGMHLDQFQRIVVNPAAVCVIRYGSQRPSVLMVNDSGSDLTALRPPARRRRTRRSGDAVVGGGAGDGST